ncbi:MAG: hypothetical protein R2765_12695 [Ferruginibacter sp.]
MQKLQSVYSYCIIFLKAMFLLSCNNKKTVKDKDVVTNPVSMDSHVTENISNVLSNVSSGATKIYDSISLHLPLVVKEFYSQENNAPIWSSATKWKPLPIHYI